MVFREPRGPYLKGEALRLNRAFLSPPSTPPVPGGGLEYHYFHVDTAPLGVSLLS